VNPRAPLPVDALLPEIVNSLKSFPNLVIEAPPGAGKTTRVPPALLELVRGGVVVLEPRRIAARLSARRVAGEMGEPVGQTVGYQVRFEESVGPRTRLRFVTEGVLTRRLISDPELKGVDAVVLDEFHERHIESDLALALLKRLQHTRPELRIVVMSATLDTKQVAAYLNDCPILRSEGRQFPLNIRHLPHSPKTMEAQLADALELLIAEEPSGDVLAFLPGVAEIRRSAREAQTIARRAGLLVLPLHSDLPLAEQDRAIAPATQRKVILATNVAESSVTVEGVTAVIDSGLARVATHSEWTGLPTLAVSRISKASAKQRAGRAGRTAPGRVLRLYTAEDYQRRPESDEPEILRSELSQLCLTLRAMRIDPQQEMDWLDTPPALAFERAALLLDRLGATGAMVTQLARYPLHPRLARMLTASMERGVGEDGCIAAALLGSGARFEKNDLLAAIEAPLDYRAQQQAEQLRRIGQPGRQRGHNDDALLMSVLAGFPDRVARRRTENQVLLANGTSAEVAGEPPQYEFMVAVDAEDRKDKPLPLVRLTARIEPEWLIELFPESVRDQSGVEWNRVTERVEAVSALLYQELVIQQSRGALPDPDASAELLFRKALEAGIDRFVDKDLLDPFLSRVKFAGLETPNLEEQLRTMCQGLRSFADLKNATVHFVPLLEQKIGMRKLNEIAPERIRLAKGRETKVHYETGKPPWIASRLQDFFGMKETPRIGAERTPVVLHLLAPNQRAVQTTTDLAGFWERLYPQVRRELMRRYPRHQWPEKP
jgi:ATP-dependent helicase HrpB